MARSVGDPTTPPVLQFTLRVLDAQGPEALAEICARDMVDLFGAVRARVLGEDGVWAESGTAAQADQTVSMCFRLSGPDEPSVRLDVELRRGPDLGIVRQQLLDLISVVRRAWRNGRRLDHERRRAREDALTGLDNRRALEEYLEHALAQARFTGSPLTLMLVDLDHFKAVNDTQGHPAGDDVLMLAAATFREHLRPSDRVCRFGGDEFLLVLNGLPAAVAVPVAERLRRAFQGHERARGTTMSIGVADTTCMAPDAQAAADLIALVDESLYAAKTAGRNQTYQAAPEERAS